MTTTGSILSGCARSGVMLAIICAAVAWTGCDNTIEPLDNDGGDQFAVQGYLDMAEDVQRVRVEGLRSSILGEPVDLSGVIVTTRDHTTGEIVEWEPETVESEGGSTVTIYSAEIRPEAGREYTMEIRRPGSSGTVAVTRVPSRPEMSVTNPVNLVQTVFLYDLPRPPDYMAMQYDVILPENNQPRTVEIVYAQAGMTAVTRDRLDIRLGIDRYLVLGRLSRGEGDARLTLAELGLVVRLPSDEFEHENRSSNITNGEGFFGSVAHFEFTWTLPSDVVDEIGFEDGQFSG